MNEREVVGKVERFQNALKRFVSIDPQRRDSILPEAVKFLNDRFNKDIVDTPSNGELRQNLEAAAQLAIQTKFIIVNGAIKPWEGNYTLILIAQDGKTIAGVQNQASGEDKFHFALQKALLHLHLDDVLMKGGLRNVRNIEYLAQKEYPPEKKFKPLENLFMGTAREPIRVGDQLFYIGAAGCDVDREYLAGVLGLGENSEGKKVLPGKDTQAGLFDNIFCDRVASYLTSGEILPTDVTEPEEIRRLRYQN